MNFGLDQQSDLVAAGGANKGAHLCNHKQALTAEPLRHTDKTLAAQSRRPWYPA